ncbi:MAG: hypothetical protein HOC23_11975 [Halieaceae bacterium]|jgi:hypothetical protein|nr:hypothetical protein [Halieaceae bacterium]
MRCISTIIAKFLIILPLLLSGCGDQVSEPLSKEEAVRLRAQGWMDALLNRNLEEAYSYTSPSYRQFATAMQYNARVAGTPDWETGIVERVECKEQLCDVRYKVKYHFAIPDTTEVVKNTRPFDYKWIEVDSEWWLWVPK